MFEDSNIYVHYEEDAVTIPIVRRLGSNSNKIISSVCRTRPLTAISGLHFVPMRDNLTFGINESQKFIRLDLNQKDFENEEGTGIIFCVNRVTFWKGGLGCDCNTFNADFISCVYTELLKMLFLHYKSPSM